MTLMSVNGTKKLGSMLTMINKSLDTVYKDKEAREQLNLKVKKSFTTDLDNLYIEDGFNVRYGELTVESVAELKQAYLDGQPIPPIVVEVQPDNRLKVIAGHRRYTALTSLVNDGHDVFKRVLVDYIREDPINLIKYMVGENSGKNLNAVDIALVCGKLKDLGLKTPAIAANLNYSESKVNYHLTINKMSDEVKQLILSDKIAADLAADIFRKKGDKGVLDIVNGTGEKKVTRANSGIWRPTMGKAVVNMFTDDNVEVLESDQNFTNLKIPTSDYEKIIEAVKALNGSE